MTKTQRLNFTASIAIAWMVGMSALFVSGQAMAGVIFQDDFNTGDILKKLNGAAFWTNNSSSSIPPGATGRSTITVKPETTSGDFSVRALYAGSLDLTVDARPELRFNLGGQYPELWVSFRVYIPSNYYHRDALGSDNNKFFIIDNTDGSQYFDFEIWLLGTNGGDRLSFNSKYNGVAQGHKFYATDTTIGTPADRGKWHNYVLHIKLATTAISNDGMAQIWKNGVLTMNFQNLAHYTPGANYFGDGYIFGASNSGFNEDTELRLDDIVFSDSPVGIAPAAPGNVIVR